MQRNRSAHTAWVGARHRLGPGAVRTLIALHHGRKMKQ